MLAAANLALRWVDRGYDHTCSAVIHPSEWWSDDRCQPIMTYRLLGAIALLVCAVACIVALVRRRWDSTAAMVFAGVVILASVSVVVVNELRWMGDQGWL
jgi:predicted nucleic acid-binding Zn ribbon protein